METTAIYRDLEKRTLSAVFIGVTGPTRTGKSTFVKTFMEKLVLPNMDDPQARERARDELPQSGSGRTIMTAEPKFVPEQPVEISPDGTAHFRVRMIDSVGYIVPGAVGAEEDGEVRMVSTPWYDYEIPMPEAAELGTQKVMQEHATVGIVVTTDGTVTDLPREAYAETEQKAISDMQQTGKPFVILLNTAQPEGAQAQELAESLQEKYGAKVIPADCRELSDGKLAEILQSLLYEFPVTELQYYMPGWVLALDAEHPFKQSLFEALRRSAEQMDKISKAEPTMASLASGDLASGYRITDMDLGSGKVVCRLDFPEEMFYEILSEKTGRKVENDGDLMALLEELSASEKIYEKVAAALEQTEKTGYGIVMPEANEVRLEKPQLVRKGGNYAIKLKASAPSIHIIRTKKIYRTKNRASSERKMP